MPEGVEHWRGAKLPVQSPVDLISDAGRRWAQRRSLVRSWVRCLIWSPMPEGVEHCSLWTHLWVHKNWFDLRCRKALSTHTIRFSNPYLNLIWSPMPEGVEHIFRFINFLMILLWFDLRCRKALSTYTFFQIQFCSGVDLISDAGRRWAHALGDWEDYSSSLIWSPMPEGVEHLFLLS